MKIWQYLDITPSQFQTKYVETGLVDVAYHDEFPLEMFTYGREATYSNVWDNVTRKCRGIIYSTETEEIIARPFEKFFNLDTAGMPETNPSIWTVDLVRDLGEPEVWEKMDGFLATLYKYKGKSYIASKGSFHSTHAKWATAWYQANVQDEWPEGYTPVFEGICSSLRIVVGYTFEGLVLLALVNKETGEELSGLSADGWAKRNGVERPRVFAMSAADARTKSLDVDVKNFEGYVLAWRRAGQTPFRLKVKYVDYLRLHRMVSGVSAKAIYNCLAGNEYKGDLDEWTNESTPWFSKFVSKWVRALQTTHDQIAEESWKRYDALKPMLVNRTLNNLGEIRREFAAEVMKPENKKYAGVLFAMLDGKDFERVIWKMVKPMIKASKPMLDVSKM